MAEVGIRELRDHLSKYLNEVQQGHDVIVTDRGRAIAQTLPMNHLECRYESSLST